ncbi:hypothetical protein PPL_01761 [Heterostelium album PN500]|uniref:FHA domain-containing protein n=1 Tax=Heterostelium pallidum (strain ATCC 26659 / Pp 5 / PN500) TaxID=670386 RepID=D3B0E5_HETP5|nr:hypothetical protein PPL_01761 [Heterostelium album PN500]EFA84769.1 hypothetical protein PPL_01761 [Heterostelium album PN500]|eukprot:XP_020436881.1 hypothetical protein PPL_01761 [Heterostelium album PN500]
MSLEQSTQELILFGQLSSSQSQTQQPSSSPPKEVIPPSSIVKTTRKRNDSIITTATTTTTTTRVETVSTPTIDLDCPFWASEPMSSRNDHLKFYKGGERSSTFTIPLDDLKYIILGRSTTLCDYALTHPTISRKHAMLAHDSDGRLNIVDLNSSHGTFIDQVRIESSIPHLLKHGQKIYFGGDQSFMIVSNNNMNRYVAESLLLKKMDLSKKRSESPSPPDKQFEEEEESLRDEITKFYGHLNKTLHLDDTTDFESIQATIKKLTPTSSPSKKHSGAKRKNCLESYDKNVRFSSLVSKFVYSEEDQVTDQYPIVQSYDSLNDYLNNQQNQQKQHQQPNQQQSPQQPNIIRLTPPKPLLFSDEDCDNINATTTTTTTTNINSNNNPFSSTTHSDSHYLISFEHLLQPASPTSTIREFWVNGDVDDVDDVDDD